MGYHLPMDYFARLGGLVERHWSGRNRDEETLPDAADQAIRELPPAEHVDVDAFVRAFLSTDQQATRQLAPVGAFGQPGITAYFGRDFVVDVYFWINALAAIHNHPFCGLFTILRGSSLHSVYDFRPSESFGTRLAIGEVRLRKIELLKPGDARLFSLRDRPLVHTLLHVPIPTVSLVIRTVKTVDYLRYLPPSLAIAMAEPDDLIARQLKLLDLLRISGDPAYGERLRDFLAQADFETTFRAISAASGGGDLEPLLALGRKRHGARMDLIPAVLARGSKVIRENALREQYRNEDDRFTVSLLMSAETRDQVFTTLRQRYGAGDDPVLRLSRWVDSCGMFAPEDQASRVVAKSLIEGLDLPQIQERLRPVASASVAEIESFRAESLFSALGS